MNLKQTVSKMLGREVNEEYAQVFASKQFGALASFLKKDLNQDIKDLKGELETITDWGKLKNGTFTYETNNGEAFKNRVQGLLKRIK